MVTASKSGLRLKLRASGFALVELLVVIIIIAILAAAVYGLWGSKGKKSIPAKAMDKASGVDCQNMLRQVRASIVMEMQVNDDGPATIPSDMASYAKCAVSGELFVYDARYAADTATNGVRCPTHPDF